MKRVLLLCLACMMLVTAAVSAEVMKGKDSFTGGFYVSSWQYPEHFLKSIHFVKNIDEGVVSYDFSISRIRGKNSVLGNAPIEIKIDNYPVYDLKDYRYKLTGPDSYGVEYNSIIDVKFPTELAEKIKDAKRVAIRFEDARGIQYPYVLPDDVLAEWKEVINTEA